MSGDRISEAYLGKIGGTMQKTSKKRIDWICSQVSGKTVLDIGCSQGIVDIILGKEEKKVLAIDNDSESIKYAQELLLKENLDTQENIKFIVADFLSYDFADRKFDTIIMGEILEHLIDPVIFLKKASTLLEIDGKIIVSVPFGINEHPDHKRTYYFLELYRQMNQYFCIKSVDFMCSKICMIATIKKNQQESKEITIDEVMLSRIENAFYEIDNDRLQRKLKFKQIQQENSDFKDENKKLNDKNFGLKKEVNIIKNKIEIVERKERILNEQFQLLTDKKDVLEKNNREYKKQLEKANYNYKLMENKYKIIANSKLGKIQIKIWKRKNKIKAKLSIIKDKIKEIVKKSPFLCELVWKHRRKKINKSNINTTNGINITNTGGQIPIKQINNYRDNTDYNFMDRIKEYIDLIPESNGGRYYEKHNYKIGIISDEFLYQSFKDAAEFNFITPDNWEEVIKNIDFLLVVSAWRGLNEEWRGVAQENSVKRKLIYKIIDECKKMEKKVVYYSKEDPPNYDKFLGIARKCDYIFTTCAEVVDDYKRDCDNQNVHVLSFGINPLYHNPVGCKNEYKQEGAIFSGSWMAKYPNRQQDMRMLFDGVLESNNKLKIIDRNYNYTNSNIYRYPREYWECISPAIEHTVLQKVHKLYNWAININTVTKSTTMFANRGYELQASGNILISNYSLGVNNKLPMVYTVIDKEEIGKIMNGLNEEEVYKRQIEAIRSVMTNETSFDRIRQLLCDIGLKPNLNGRKILVIAKQLNDDIKEMFENQSYPYKELIDENSFNKEILNKYDIVTFFDNNKVYDMFYLEDMANGFKYTDCDYITKDAYYDGKILVKGKEHDYVNIMKDKYRTLFWVKAYTFEQLKNMNNNIELENGYSIDHFNYNTEKITKTCNGEKKLSVIVPVYNNGRYLLSKAFSSLQRSSMFENMEIILVDDGSTDDYTDKLVKYLDKNYFNVKSFLFNDGGSGTASRPRNKGIELATCDYVTYLDPDNEAVCDGYSKLYEEAVNGKYDVVVGNIVKLTDQICKNAKYYNVFKVKYGSDIVIDDMKNYMEKTKLSPMSIQAMVIKKDIIVKNNILQPVGAAGQDTLFSWEVFMNSKIVKAIDIPIHIYYAAVEGSTVNSIGRKYFKKCYLIEKPRRIALEKYNLLDIYMKLRYSYYFRNWVLKKLSSAKLEEREECIKLVYKMHQIYEDVYLNDNKMINDFINSCKNNDYNNAFKILSNLM